MKKLESAQSWDEVMKLKGRAEQLRILDALPNEIERTIEEIRLKIEREQQTQERNRLINQHV
jgi:hypothetical protein